MERKECVHVIMVMGITTVCNEIKYMKKKWNRKLGSIKKEERKNAFTKERKLKEREKNKQKKGSMPLLNKGTKRKEERKREGKHHFLLEREMEEKKEKEEREHHVETRCETD